MIRFLVSILLCNSIWLVACRSVEGDHLYAEDWQNPSEIFEFKLGPNPYQEGAKRLSLGQFYEGSASDEIVIDGQAANFYIYSNEWTSEPTFTMQRDVLSRVEGHASDKIIHAGIGWWGCGIHLRQPSSFDSWTQLWISFQSTAESFKEIQIQLKSGEVEKFIYASNYGYKNDGQWHTLTIPLQDFTNQGLDLSQVEIPFMLIGRGGNKNDVLWIDNLYFTQD